MALDTANLAQLRGAYLVGSDGERIGKIDEIYLDDRTGEPEWALVNTGLFGMRSSFVPLRDATARVITGTQVRWERSHPPPPGQPRHPLEHRQTGV